MSNRSTFVNEARKYIGCKESNGTHKKIIDIYNSHKPLARGYKVKYTDEWCATFVSAMSVNCGYTSIIPTECSCQKQIDLFKGLGAWREDENYTPKAGDIIYYDWQDSGSGDNTGWSDHVGIVESVSGGMMTIIEGNYNCQVARRNIKINARYIRGFGVPKYTEEVPEVLPDGKFPDLSNYHGVSIVTGLNSVGYDSSFESRKVLWYALGNTATYIGSASQNLAMIEQLGGTTRTALPSLKGYKGFSIVDGLKAFGYNSTFSYRKELWKLAGKTTTYLGTSQQNTELLNILKNN